MSTTTTLNAKTLLLEQLDRICKGYLGDLAWIPEDKLGVSPMGVARSPLEFTAECIGFNGFVADLLVGKPREMPSEDQRKEFYKSIDSLDKARAGLESSVSRLCAAIEAMSEDELSGEAATPWGEKTTKYRLASMCATHMIYHDGQINYIQALYGDGESHWG